MKRKTKKVTQHEAIVVGAAPDTYRTLESLKSLTVRDAKTGEEFILTEGFTQAQRYDLWKNIKKLIAHTVVYSRDPLKFKCFKAIT